MQTNYSMRYLGPILRYRGSIVNHAGHINWPNVRAEYEENRTSVRALARAYHISDTAIRKRATAERWPRKPGPDQVRHGSPPASPAGTLSVARKKRKGTDGLQTSSPTTAATLTSAQLVRRARALIEDLLRELAETNERIGEIEDGIINETSQDADGRRRQAMLRAVSLANRSLAAKNLAHAIRALSYRSTPRPLGKKEQAQRDAEFLAKNPKYARRRPPSPQYREKAD
jgi:hypothetical protein